MRKAIVFLINAIIAIVGLGGSAVSQPPPTIPITVTPQVIQPTGGKLPLAMNMTVACGDKTSHDFTKDTLVVIGDGLTLSTQPASSGICSITYGVTIASSASSGAHQIQLVDQNKNTLGTADINVLDSSAGPLPPGLAPQADTFWNVMSQKACSDTFGTRVAESLYCIQLTIGNNSGYPLKVARIGFSNQFHPATNAPPPLTVANSSYRSTRAILLKENVTNGRNIAYNVLQATGTLMLAFSPYFGAQHTNVVPNTVNNARLHWTTASSIVSGPLLAAFNLVAPNPILTQLNNLDDESSGTIR